MRKSILAVALSFSLSGCAGLSNFETTVVAPTVAAVQQAAVTVCGFLPTATSVAGILATGVPWLSTAEAIAQAICQSVASVKVSGKLGAVPPSVGGVIVHGRFVR